MSTVQPQHSNNFHPPLYNQQVCKSSAPPQLSNVQIPDTQAAKASKVQAFFSKWYPLLSRVGLALAGAAAVYYYANHYTERVKTQPLQMDFDKEFAKINGKCSLDEAPSEKGFYSTDLNGIPSVLKGEHVFSPTELLNEQISLEWTFKHCSMKSSYKYPYGIESNAFASPKYTRFCPTRTIANKVLEYVKSHDRRPDEWSIRYLQQYVRKL